MTTATETTIVTRTLLEGEERISHTEALFGLTFPLKLEPTIYGITDRIAPAYCGGFWRFWRLGNGGFYMAPDSEARYQAHCMNYWEGELSADALGIVSCLTAYSHLSFGGPEEFAWDCAKHYHLLREYVCEHAEVAGILGAID